MVLHLKSCCCGCSLSAGSVIIGILSAIGAFCQLIQAILGASVSSGQAQKEVNTITKNFDLDDKPLDNISNVETSKTATAVYVLMAIVCSIHLIVSIMLIFGASSENPRLIRPWIIYSVVAAVTEGILYLVVGIDLLVEGMAALGVLLLLTAGVGMSIFVYFILVVNSFINEITSQRLPGKI